MAPETLIADSVTTTKRPHKSIPRGKDFFHRRDFLRWATVGATKQYEYNAAISFEKPFSPESLSIVTTMRPSE